MKSKKEKRITMPKGPPGRTSYTIHILDKTGKEHIDKGKLIRTDSINRTVTIKGAWGVKTYSLKRYKIIKKDNRYPHGFW